MAHGAAGLKVIPDGLRICSSGFFVIEPAEGIFCSAVHLTGSAHKVLAIRIFIVQPTVNHVVVVVGIKVVGQTIDGRPSGCPCSVTVGVPPLPGAALPAGCRTSAAGVVDGEALFSGDGEKSQLVGKLFLVGQLASAAELRHKFRPQLLRGFVFQGFAVPVDESRIVIGKMRHGPSVFNGF